MLETIRSIHQTNEDKRVVHDAIEKALQHRLRSAREAKNLANRRADVAEKALRDLTNSLNAVLDQFKMLEVK